VWAHAGAIGLASVPPAPAGRPRQFASGIRGPKRRFPIGDFRRDNRDKLELLARERSSHEISDAVDRRAVGTVPSLIFALMIGFRVETAESDGWACAFRQERD
jgi:hypothetical protein